MEDSAGGVGSYPSIDDISGHLSPPLGPQNGSPGRKRSTSPFVETVSEWVDAQVSVALGKVPPLSFWNRLSFGVGGVVEVLQMTVFFTFGFIYWTQCVGLSSSRTGLAAMISLAIDAVMDPVIGNISDVSTNARFGRRHTYMYASVIPLAICLYLLFNVPSGLSQTWLFVWATVSFCLLRIFTSFYSISHTALGADLAQGYDERTSIMSFTAGLGWATGPFTIFIGLMMFMTPTEEIENGTMVKSNYPPFLRMVCIMIIVAGFWSALGTSKFIPYIKPISSERGNLDTSLIRSLWGYFKNPSYRSLIGSYFFKMIGLGVKETVGLLGAFYFWRISPKNLSLLPATYPLGAFCAPFLARYFCARFDKRNTAVGFQTAYVVIGALPALLGLARILLPSTPSLLPILVVHYAVMACLVVCNQLMALSMLADVAEEVEVKTGRRVEASLFAARSFCGKASSGLGHVIVGVGLDAIGFPSGVAPSQLDEHMRMKLGWFCLIADSSWVVIAIGIMTTYKLNREISKAHREALTESKLMAEMQSQEAAGS